MAASLQTSFVRAPNCASTGSLRSSSSTFSGCATSISSVNLSSLRTQSTSGGSLKVECVYGKGFIPSQHRWMYEGIEKKGPDDWNKTWYPKAADHLNIDKTWYIVDATNLRLGRLASTIAIHIRGKNLPTFTPSADMGAYVVVVNAEKIEVTGKKRSQKLYRRHSGRPGGLKQETFDQLQRRIPERIIEHAVKGMLPKGSLGRELFRHLKVYEGPKHPHEAQRPVPLPLQDKHIMLVSE
eukprot:TRINITY_DN667_c0_g1_i2.p1 TRINITY_DN667_c0_g1~~TRINITY_DN667_c0_g1_i2.p1  ORF type:complete len:239 (+),score=60.51 TRINITY_DN667_c0_g1_i2:70-786(+)